MLPDWIEQKDELERAFQRALRRRTFAEAVIVARVSHVAVSEGSRIDFIYPDGSRQTMEMDRNEATAEFDRAAIASGDVQQLADAVGAMGKQFAETMEKKAIEILKQAAPHHASVFRGTAIGDLREQFLRGLESLDFGFDHEGKPTVFVVVSPEVAARFHELDSPEFASRVNEITKKKHDEWVRRENSRRLVD